MKLLLIDGNSLINRSFYAIKMLSNKKGVPTNAIAGFFSTLLRLSKNVLDIKLGESGMENPQALCVCFDLREPTFRHKMYDGYKSSRKGMPDELAAQMPYIKEILDAMGIPRLELAGYEADDLIGTLARIAGEDNVVNVIATGDRDSFQLINDMTSVCLASTKEEIMYTPAKIDEVYGISPEQFIEVKALMGDKSDDIPGVAGIGEKTAFSLIHVFKNVDNVYGNIDSPNISKGVRAKLEKDKDNCYMSRELGRVNTAVPLTLTDGINDFVIKEADREKLAEMLSELELNALLKKLKIEPVIITDFVDDSPKVKELEERLSPVLRSMENAGIKIDAESMSRFGGELEKRIEQLQTQIYGEAGEEFNIASTKQLGEILFNKLSLPCSKKTKTGYSTDSDVLEGLYDMHAVIPLIMEYRELTKLNSTYVQGLLSHVKEDGRIHTTFKNETRTGRLSSAEPNIQNIPVRTERGRIFRRFFVADNGCVLIDADYSQIELRVLAYIANDRAMLEAFGNNADIHLSTAAQVFGVSETAVTREMRSAAKAVNFGIVYGMGAFSLAKNIGVTVAEANEYINRYLARYVGIKEYLEKTVAEAKENGYVKTLLGRVRYIPEIKSNNANLRNNGERIAKNTPIQGTAADIIKIAMINVHGRLEKENCGANLILQIHDELIIESAENEAAVVTALLEEEMVKAGGELGIVLSVDVSKGKSWYETH